MRLKLIRFLNYDVNEGLFRFWKRYLLVILLGIIMCATLNTKWIYLREMYDVGFSPLEYGIDQFWGRYPYFFNASLPEQFTIPFSWILQYLLLAYCIGNYTKDDMQGFGMQMMLKSRQRSVWWLSKVIWSILVNLTYFGLLWCVNISYAWIMSGDVGFVKHSILTQIHGSQAGTTGVAELILMSLLMPLLVGIVQSLFQLIGSVCFGGVPVMIVLTGILVLSSYYANRFLVHGYAMVCRYYKNYEHPDYEPLELQFGLIYLGIAAVVLIVGGYIILRKKDILEKN